MLTIERQDEIMEILNQRKTATVEELAKFTGEFIPLNWYTVIGGGTLGLPGICGIILAQILI